MLDFFHVGDRRYARLPHAPPGLIAALSTRPLDVSARLDDRAPQRAANRAQMATDLGLDPSRLCHCVQVHQTRLALVDAQRAAGPLEGFDGALTNQPGVPLMTFSADCPLILIFDSHRRALGLAHASWRCTVARIAPLLIAAMRDAYGCRPDDLLAFIGPGAGPCCYEVREDVYAAAADLPQRERCFARRDGRMYFDLWEANRALLAAAGLRPESIASADVCTLCRNDVFYSFRKEGPGCGHFGLMAAIAP